MLIEERHVAYVCMFYTVMKNYLYRFTDFGLLLVEDLHCIDNSFFFTVPGSREDSPTIWPCYATLNHYYYSFYLEIDSLYGL